MKIGLLSILPIASFLIAANFIGCSNSPSKAWQTPEPAVAFAATGQHPNLFKHLGLKDKDIQARINKDYQQFFHGNHEDQRVFYPAGENEHGAKAYILDVNSRDVRSEGMSYGMMIAVQMDRKDDFDAIWNWSLEHMYHDDPKHPASGYFIWSLKPDGTPNDEMPAPDGEEYYATALYFAAARWGNGEGIYHYTEYADRILRDSIHKPIITGQANGRTMSATTIFSVEHKMVRFTPDLENSEHTDASYHLPSFYEIWARVGPKEDREFWRQAAQVSRDYFVKAAHPVTALTPDYGEFDGRPWAAGWREESVDFRYDAWRTAMNWSMDWSWWAADPRQRELSDNLQAFFESQGMTKYQSLYTLDGKPLGLNQTTALISMNAVASLAATHPRREKFVRALWKHQLPTGQYRYYDGMLYLFALLHLSGEYKDWTSIGPHKDALN